MNTKMHCIIFCASCSLVFINSYATTEQTHPQSNIIDIKLPLDKSSPVIHIDITKYDEDLYQLAYNIYLANTDLKNAYSVAAAAVQQNPGSITWRKRLGQVALWYDQPGVTLEQYKYIALHTNDKNFLEKAQNLAKKLNDDISLGRLLSFQISKGSRSEIVWQQYIDVMIRLGEPQKIIDFLNKFKSNISKGFYLSSLSNVYQIMNKPDLQFNTLIQYQNSIGLTPNMALRLSELYISKGELDNAFNVLNTAKSKAANSDFDFWKNFSRFAELLNKDDSLLAVDKILMQQKDPGEDVYYNLISLTDKTNPLEAYFYSKKGLKLYPKSYILAESSFSYALQTNQLQDIPELNKLISPDLKQKIVYDSAYWEASANYWRKTENPERGTQIFLEGMNYVGTNKTYQSDYILFLIKNKKIEQLAETLIYLQKEEPYSPLLWDAFAQGYARLNNFYMVRLILQQYYDTFYEHSDDPYWLISFKDVLENSFFPIESAAVGRYAWPIYLHLLSNQKTPLDYIQLLDYAKLSLLNAPGDITQSALALLQKYPTKDTELLLLSWALKRNNFVLAREISLYYAEHGMQAPVWAVLSIALHRHDLYKIRDVIESKNEIVSYRDQISAEKEIEAIPKSQTTAFNAMKTFQHDEELYEIFKEVTFKTASQFYISQDFYQYASAEGPRTTLFLTYFISPTISLTPYNSLWLPNNITTTQASSTTNSAVTQTIINLPPHDERTGLKAKITQLRGDLTIDLGYRNNLNGFGTAKVLRTYTVSEDLSMIGTLGFHQEANDTLGLLVGGMKNDIIFDFNYLINSKNIIRAEFAQNFFYTQGKEHVANGTQSTLEFDHKFWRSYPDWTITLYGTTAQYYNQIDQLTGSILTLVPPGETANANFLIPANFVEYGVTASIGQNFKEDYTHAWRPFISGTLSKNSVVGPGKLISVGIAGMVFGRDHLLLYYERGTNQGAGIQLERLFRCSYLLYF